MYDHGKNPVLTRFTGRIRGNRARVRNRTSYRNHVRYVNGCIRGNRTVVRLVGFGLGNDAVYAIG